MKEELGDVFFGACGRAREPQPQPPTRVGSTPHPPLPVSQPSPRHAWAGLPSPPGLHLRFDDASPSVSNMNWLNSRLFPSSPEHARDVASAVGSPTAARRVPSVYASGPGSRVCMRVAQAGNGSVSAGASLLGRLGDASITSASVSVPGGPRRATCSPASQGGWSK